MSNQAPPPGGYPPPGGNQPPGGYGPPNGGYQQGPPPGGYQGGYQEQPRKGGSGLAVAALVLGILALLSSWTVIGGILLGLIGLVLGFIASGRAKKGMAGGRGMAIIGIITSLLAIVIAIVFVVAVGSFLNSDSAKNLQDCIEQAGNDQAQLDQCEQDFTDELTN
jgi:O-antigen ligase